MRMKEIFNKIKKHKLAFLLLGFALIISLISLGTAIVSGSISINGQSKINKNSWVIYFDHVKISEDSVEASYPAQIVDREKTQIEFAVHLDKPGDFYEFRVWTINDGSIDAYIKSIEKYELTDAQKEYLDFEVTYDTGEEIKPCDILYALDNDSPQTPHQRLIKAVVKYKTGIDKSLYPTEGVNLNLFFKINYVQDATCDCRETNTCPSVKNKLTVVPNDGIAAKTATYKGRTVPTYIYLNEDESVTLEDSIYKLHNSDGYCIAKEITDENGKIAYECDEEATGTYTYDDDTRTFTMGKEDQILLAQYSQECDYVARIENSYYCTIQAAFDAAGNSWNDNTVHLLHDTTEYPTNNTSKAFTFDLEGFKVTGTTVNSSNGNITLINGTMQSEDEYKYVFKNYGTLTLGEDDGIVYVENSIALIGNRTDKTGLGLYNVNINENGGSKFYFYDGYIEGKDALNGYTDKASGYYVFIDHRSDLDCERAYLVSNITRAVSKTLTNGELFYHNLNDSFRSIQSKKYWSKYDEESTREFGDADFVDYAIRNFEAAYNLEISKEDYLDAANVIFDIKGFSVETGNDIINTGKLSIKDSSSEKGMLLVSESIDNSGDLVFEDIEGRMTTDYNLVNNTGNVELNNTRLTGKNSYAINNGTNGTVDLDDDSVLTSVSSYGLNNSDNNFVLSGGTVYGFRNTGKAEINGTSRIDMTETWGICGVDNSGTLTLSDGEIKTTREVGRYTGVIVVYKDLVCNTGTLNQTGGLISSIRTSIVNNNGTYNLRDGLAESEKGAVATHGTINVYGGTATSNSDNVLSGNGTTNVYGGSVNAPNGTTVSSSNANIYGGELTASDHGVHSLHTTMSGGKITADNIGINSAYDTAMSGGEIYSVNTGIQTSGLNMSDGLIISSEANGIESTGTGIITGGEIIGELYGVYNKENLTIGKNEGEISITVPTIRGGSYGLYITGLSTKFFDGILKGQVDGYYGNITEVPTGATVIDGTETIDGVLYNTDYLDNIDNWLAIGQPGDDDYQEFNNLNSASVAALSGQTIYMTRDADIRFEQTIVDPTDTKEIIFDFNGHKLKTNHYIFNDATTTIIDSSEGKTSEFDADIARALYNRNDLVIDYIYMNDTSTAAIYNHSQRVHHYSDQDRPLGYIYESNGESPTLKINSGTFISHDNDVNQQANLPLGNVIYNNGTAIIEDATITADNYAIAGSGKTTINNITITSKKTAINGGTVIMNNGTINAQDNATQSCTFTLNDGYVHSVGTAINGSTLTLNGGTIISEEGYGANDSAYVNGGLIQSNSTYAIYFGPYFEQNGGKVIGKTDGVHNHCYGSYYCSSWGTGLQKAGYIEGQENHGVYIDLGTFITQGGKIQGQIDGIYSNGGRITVGTEGVDEQNISITNPEVIGLTRYGVEGDKSDYVKFFDGIIKGLTDSTYGLIGLIPDGAMIKSDYEYINRVEYKTKYLVKKGNWVRVGDKEFNSINAAADYISGSGTMYLIADPYIDFYQTLPDDKNITLDLNGHTITTTQAINVARNGTARIVDSVGGGWIHNIRDTYSDTNDSAVVNSGTLTVDGGHFKSDYHYAISSTGTLTYNGGDILSYGGIDAQGTLVFNGGNIEATNVHAINTYHTALKITGGYMLAHNDVSVFVNTPGLVMTGGEIVSLAKEGLTFGCGGYYDVCSTADISGGTIHGVNTGMVGEQLQYYNISGGNFIGDEKYGIQSNVAGHITGGTMTGGIYGVYHRGNTLTIGNDDGLINIDSPVLRGETYGLYKAGGTVVFNDGILKGITFGHGDDSIDTIPRNTSIFYDTETIDDKLYQTAFLYSEGEIVKNLTTNVIYSNFQTSLDEANEGDTLQAINNILIYYDVVNTNPNEFTLDMNGHFISTNKQIVNKGNIHLVNTSDNDGLIKTSSGISLIYNDENASLSTDNIKFKNSGASNYVINNRGSLTFTNSSIDSINGINNSNDLVVNNSVINTSGTTINNSKNVVINDGIYNGSYSFYSNSVGTLLINDGEFNGTFYNAGASVGESNRSTFNGTFQNNNATLTVNEGNVSGRGTGVSNTGTLTFNSSVINLDTTVDRYSPTTYNAVTNSGTLNLNDTNVLVDKNVTGNHTYIRGIYNTGNINMDEDALLDVGSADNTTSYLYGLYATGNSNVYIKKGNIKVASRGNTNYGVYTETSNSKVTLNAGTLDVRYATTSYGAYIDLGTFEIGHYEGKSIEYNPNEPVSETNPLVSTDDPYIYVSSETGKGIGVKKVNGEFNFYDGLIRASRFAKPDTTSHVEDMYEVTVYVDVDTSYEYAYLEYMPNDYQGSDIVAQIGTKSYTSVSDAINKAEPGDEIVLIKTTIEDLVIPSGKSILLNLHGRSITTQTVIEQGATLQIFGGSLQNYGDTTVTNNGTFIMGKDDGTVSSTSVRVVGEGIALDNNGTFEMYDGYLQGNPANTNEIDKIAEYSRLYITKDDENEKKFLQSLSEEDIKAGLTDLYLDIDPASGEYEGSKEPVRKYLKYQQTYELEEPVKHACDFTGWEASDPSVLDNNVVTMDVSDVKVTATWKISEDAVAHINDNYFLSIEEALEAAEENDTVILIKDVDEDVTNTKNITLDLGGHTINGVFINNGELRIVNGTINNPDGVGLVNNKLLTIGLNDGTIDSGNVNIYGTTIGIEQNGKFNFYDGTVFGNVALLGRTDSLPKGYFLYTERDANTGLQKVYLIGNPENAVAQTKEGGDQFFFSLQDAIDTAYVTGYEIYILRDFEATYALNVKEDYDITINMSSYDITTGNDILINGKLHLYDSSEDVGSITSAKSIVNNGTLNISDINIKTTKDVVTITNNGTLNLVNSTIEGTSKVAVDTYGEITMDENTVLKGVNYALANHQEELELSTGTIYGVQNFNKVTINEGVTLIGSNDDACVLTYGNTEVNYAANCTSSNIGIAANQANSAVINVTGGTINAASYGIFTDKNSIIMNLSGGYVKGTNAIRCDGYYAEANRVNITGGEYIGTDYGIYMQYYSGNINIENATVKLLSTNRDRYVIYQRGDTITLNDGAKLEAPNASGIYQECSLVMNEGASIEANHTNAFGVYQTGWGSTYNGGTIKTPGSGGMGIYLRYDAGVTIKDINIESGNIGIQITDNDRAGTVNVYGGHISGDNYGIYQTLSSRTINMGNKDDELSVTVPYVTGGLYGIYNSAGVVNFYNGRLRGYTYGYKNDLNNIRSKMEVYTESEIIGEAIPIRTISTDTYSSTATSNTPKLGNGYARITNVETGDVIDFDYTGDVQIFSAPNDGTYKLEVWGASGGDDAGSSGGLGGYSYGEIELSLNETLYIYVGGQGASSVTSSGGGFNGGGNAGSSGASGAGGGATHIATTSGLLSTLENNKESILIVAGGGAGQGGSTNYQGSGGGFKGATTNGGGGTQTSAGSGTNAGSFGQGGHRNGDGGGGGGGYYGGGASTNDSTGGGGSGYTGSPRLSNTVMYGYNVEASKNIWINNYLIEKEGFLKVGDTIFNSFDDAVAAIEAEGTITVIKNTSVQETGTIPAGKTITLDLNGHTLTSSQSFINQGTFIIKDSTEDKEGKIDNIKTNVIQNRGTLTVESGTLHTTANATTVLQYANSTVNVEEGAVISGYRGIGASEASNSSINVNGAKIKVSEHAIYTNQNGIVVNIADADIVSTGATAIYMDCWYCDASGLTIEGGSVTGADYGIYNHYSGNVSITDATVKTTSTNRDRYAIYKRYDTLTLNDGAKIEAPNASGIYQDCSLVMNEGAVIEANHTNAFGVYQSGWSSTYNGGTIKTPGSGGMGIYMRYDAYQTINDINIESGNIGIQITDNDRAATTNIYGGNIVARNYGIYQTLSSRTTNIGTKDKDLSTTIPRIRGGISGVYNSAGTVNFYNGRVEYGFSNSINAIRPGTQVLYEYEAIEDAEYSESEFTVVTHQYSADATAKTAKTGNGYARITNVETGEITDFDYTGEVQSFTAPNAGSYKLEVWGAQGGTVNSSYNGGYGGYSTGKIDLSEGEILYVTVGGQGERCTTNAICAGGFNGGGNSVAWSEGGSLGGSGGGATSITDTLIENGELYHYVDNKDNVVIVAGGGGGSAFTNNYNYGYGGHGGGYEGATSVSTAPDSYSNGYGSGGTQTSGGSSVNKGVITGNKSGSFGKGYSSVIPGDAAGGGGGYYGGGTGSHSGAGGGSGYVGSSRLSGGMMFGYNVPANGYVVNYLGTHEGFLRVGDTEYNSFDEAIAAIEEEGTIEVIRDSSVQETGTIPAGKTIALDLNGHTLTATQSLINQGTLTIKDSSASKTGMINNLKTNVIRNYGNLTVESGTLHTTASATTVLQYANSTVNVEEEAVISGYRGIGASEASTSTINVNGAKIRVSEHAIYTNQNGIVVNIADGELTSTGATAILMDCWNCTASSLTIDGGSVTGADYGIYNHYSGNVSITDATVKTTSTNRDRYAIYKRYDTLTLNDGAKIEAPNASGIYQDCSLVMNEGAVIEANHTNAFGVYQSGWSSTYNGGTIKTPGSGGMGIYMRYDAYQTINDINIESGNIGIQITDNDRAATTNIYGGSIVGANYAVYQTLSNRTTNIGNKDEEVSITSPSLVGGLYGIYSSAGTVNFYSGVITGDIQANNRDFTNIRAGYELSINEHDAELIKTYSTTIVDSEPVSEAAKIGNGYAKLTYKSVASDMATSLTQTDYVADSENKVLISQEAADELSTIHIFDYTGDVQTFTAPVSGYYKLEAWGAQGYSNSTNSKGAYTSGMVHLDEGETIYVYVGQGLNSSYNTSSFNAGTGNSGGYPGGGATDFRLVPGNWRSQESLVSRIMVAGGSGAGTYNGPGGTLVGGAGNGTRGGSQTATGGRQSDNYTNPSFGIGDGGCAGGNGYYPGGAATCANGAGGGSSYISGYKGAIAIKSADDISPRLDSNGDVCEEGTTDITCSYHYSGKKFINAVMIAGDKEMPTHDGTSTMVGNSGNGYAKISYVEYAKVTFNYNLGTMSSDSIYIRNSDTMGSLETPKIESGDYVFAGWYYDDEFVNKVKATDTISSDINIYARYLYNSAYCSTQVGREFLFDYSGKERIFNTECAGTYKLEVWGAQGGNNNSTSGLGSYSEGLIDLAKDEILYINVGGKGGVTPAGTFRNVPGGYNGGGYTNGQNCCGRTYGSGGGATHIATVSGLLSTLENNRDSILIVAGGGGGGFNGSGGGNAGGFVGQNGQTSNGYSPGNGALQGRGGISTYAAVASGSFGQGGAGSSDGSSTGGGGGYYGGAGSGHIDAAGGGTGYIGNARLYDKAMYGYNVQVSNNSRTVYLVEETAFINNQTTSEDFVNLQAAIDEANNGDTIKFITDKNISYSVTIPNNKSLTFDMNGHLLVMNKTITVNGSLNVIDTGSSDIKGLIRNNNGTVFSNTGTLSIETVNIKGSNGINNSGVLNITNSEVSASNQAIINSGKFTIEDAIINGSNYAIYDSSINESTISDSVITSGSSAVYVYNAGKVTVNDCTMTGYLYNNNSNGKLNINGGTHKGYLVNKGFSTIDGLISSYSVYTYDSVYVYNNSGNMTFKNGKIISENTYQYGNDVHVMHNTGTLTSTNNTYIGTGSRASSGDKWGYGIVNHGILTSNYDKIDISVFARGMAIHQGSTSDARVSNVNVSVHDNYTSMGIRAYSGNIVNESGTYDIKANNDSYGIYVESGNATNNSGTYLSRASVAAYGAYVDTGTLNLLGGELISTNSPTTYGIRISTGYVYQGTYDGAGTDAATMDPNSPSITSTGSTTGIGVSTGNGSYFYYDGKFITSTSFKSDGDILTGTEKDYEPRTTPIYEIADSYTEGETYYILDDNNYVQTDITEFEEGVTYYIKSANSKTVLTFIK